MADHTDIAKQWIERTKGAEPSCRVCYNNGLMLLSEVRDSSGHCTEPVRENGSAWWLAANEMPRRKQVKFNAKSLYGRISWDQEEPLATGDLVNLQYTLDGRHVDATTFPNHCWSARFSVRNSGAEGIRTQVSKKCFKDLSFSVFKKPEDQDATKQPTITLEGVAQMGDIYAAAQVGAQGSQSHANDMSFAQIWRSGGADIDLKSLAKELETLRGHLKTMSESSEHDVEIGALANAQIAAEKSDGPGVLKYLAQAGTWAFKAATEIGVRVATAALKMALQLP